MIETCETDFTSGFHISHDHLEVESSDRQNVASAVQLFSVRTACLFRKYFPNHPARLEFADIIECISNCVKIMTSRTYKHRTDNWCDAFRVNYQVLLSISCFSV